MNVSILTWHVDLTAPLRAAAEFAARDALQALDVPLETSVSMALHQARGAARVHATATIQWAGPPVHAEGIGREPEQALRALHGALLREAHHARRTATSMAQDGRARTVWPIRRPGSAPAVCVNRPAQSCPPGYQ